MAKQSAQSGSATTEAFPRAGLRPLETDWIACEIVRSRTNSEPLAHNDCLPGELNLGGPPAGKSLNYVGLWPAEALAEHKVQSPEHTGHMGSSSARPACGMGDSVLTPMVLPLCRNPGMLLALWNSLELGSGR